MNIALFGGTFDPIHRGHLTVARAAARRFKLKKVWFVPADIPPHKQKTPITSYFHRYSMVALALAGEPDFLPSLLEAPDPEPHMERRPSYSIDTVRRVKAGLRKADRLYFLIGIDAFRDIAKWHEAGALLKECEFIIAARPRYSLADVTLSMPKELRPGRAKVREFRQSNIGEALRLPGVTLHFIPETHEDVSATQIRAAVRSGKGLEKLVPDTVVDYIQKERLYRNDTDKPVARIRRSSRSHETR